LKEKEVYVNSTTATLRRQVWKKVIEGGEEKTTVARLGDVLKQGKCGT